MKVTNVTVNRWEKGNLRGFADVQFDDCLETYGWRIWNKKDGSGLFVAPPSKPNDNPDSKYKYSDIVRVTNEEFLEDIQEVVLDAYNAAGKEDDSISRPQRPTSNNVQVDFSDPNNIGNAPL